MMKAFAATAARSWPVLVAVFLNACVSASPDWIDTPPQDCVDQGRAAPILVVDVPASDIARYCGVYDDGVALACIAYNRTVDVWVLFTTSREPWILDHEYAHYNNCWTAR